MRGVVNDNCIGCGLCAGILPEVFRMTESGQAEGDEVPAGMEDTAQEARDGCPVSAIDLEED